MFHLEHVNMTVPDIEATAKFLMKALPNIWIRGRGSYQQDQCKIEWLHVGDDANYICLNSAHSKAAPPASGHFTGPIANHAGFEVDSIEGVCNRLSAAGYGEGSLAEDHPFRKRIYFKDSSGFDWEFIEYRSDKPAERNRYD